MDNKRPGYVCPDKLYDFKDLARILDISADQFKKHYLKEDRVPFIQAGYTYWILGADMIRSVAQLRTTWSKISHKGPGWPKHEEDKG